ncbi:hypothetical protein LX36DRAFT_487122 [Colletotrichum falcatum]|nr:hypothetical protein LX36DRAFT_487122 [Colletotrichum falcatum]
MHDGRERVALFCLSSLGIGSCVKRKRRLQLVRSLVHASSILLHLSLGISVSNIRTPYSILPLNSRSHTLFLPGWPWLHCTLQTALDGLAHRSPPTHKSCEQLSRVVL